MHPRSLFLRSFTGSAVARPKRRLPLVVSALLALAGTSLSAESAHAQSLQMSRITTAALPELKVYVSYLDPEGKPVSGRAAGDFKLQIDAVDVGASTSVTPFEKANEPLSVVLLAQSSAVVTDTLLTQVKAGFRQISQTVASHPGSHLSVLSYATATKRLLEGGGGAEAESALGKLAVDSNAAESHLLDALKSAIELLSRQAAGQRKLIVLVSDGIDVSKEKRSFIDVGRRAQDAGIAITIVGHNEFDTTVLRNLLEISKRSYGSYRLAKTMAEVSSQLAVVADEIQKQYVITFRPSIATDGKERTIQVITSSGGQEIYSNVINVVLPAQSGSKPPPPPLPIKPLRTPPPT